MKKLILIAITALSVSACKKEKIRGCTDPVAQNYELTAESDDGSCLYLRDRYIGTYRGSQTCSSFQYPDFTFNIKRDPKNINRLNIYEIPLSGNFSYADLKSNPNEFFIPPQLFTSDLDSSQISGSGYLKGDSLFIELIRQSAGVIDTCITKAVKINEDD